MNSAIQDFRLHHPTLYHNAICLEAPGSAYSMDVQRVHSEVVRVHVEVVEDLFEGQFLSRLLQHHALCICLVGALDEVQQMLLVHTGGGVDMSVYLRTANHKQD